MTTEKKKPPLIAHIIHRFGVGGLENGLVNLINSLPEDKYRHAIICLTESGEFENRIRQSGVPVYELHKREGNDFKVHWKLWRLLRRIKPAIVHTRNLSALESNIVAALARVPVRLHGEHGRDIYDLHGNNAKYQWLRRLCSPFIHCFIALSKDLERWLRDDVGISQGKITQLYNGVDTVRFTPKNSKESNERAVERFPPGFVSKEELIIGTVGRLEAVKDPLTLVKAFSLLLKNSSAHTPDVRLVLLGDGVLRPDIENFLDEQGIKQTVWLAGSRNDVPEILSQLDIFVLPSLGEGISNTILEAMACGLPVIATDVGGNPELVVEDDTGQLVPSSDPEAMAAALEQLAGDNELREKYSHAGRKRAENVFSLETMVDNYQAVYDKYLAAKGYS